jgi:TolB-like protein
MLRQLSYATRMLAVAASFALPTVALAQADTRPVVVVYRFDNSSIGAGRADYDGMATGVQDLLITDLASNPKFRIVDRAHLNEVLTEQNLAKTGQIDQATAVRVGKILGAQYAVTGGFMSDGKGSAILTGRTIDIETTQIANPQKLTGKTDDVLGLIASLSSKLSSNMNLAPKPGAGRRVGDAGDAAKTPTQTGTATTTAAHVTPTSDVVMYSKPVIAAVQEKTMKAKLDVATMKLYSSALDAMDQKNKAKAKALFTQVLDKFPDFEPAKRNLQQVS